MSFHVSREDIADRITELLIEHFTAYGTYDSSLTLPYFQKVVRDGRVQVATIPHRTDDERLVLYRSDVKGNEADIDLLNFIYNAYFADGTAELSLDQIQLEVDGSGVSGYNEITTLIVGDDIIEVNAGSLTETFYQDNLGQFVDFSETQFNIDPSKATQILDTDIYELYPSELTKQQRINRFFREYDDLKPPYATEDVGAYGAPLTDENDDPLSLTDTEHPAAIEEFESLYDISGAPVDEREDRYITWHDTSADNENEEKTLEWLRTDLNKYYFLQETPEPDIVDERPKYRSRSSGYLKVRTLNQAVIVRNEESSDIGLIGPEPNNPIWQANGFTITMWVRFLDKVNGGTLFNFGNPLRVADPEKPDPAGFMLETFVVERENYINTNDGADLFDNGEDFATNGFFLTENVERFVRLIVRDDEGALRDSHVGNSFEQRIDTSGLTSSTIDDWGVSSSGVNPFNYTQIPIDLREWYFIVATYNPAIQEDGSFNDTVTFAGEYCTACSGFGEADDCDCDPDYWRGNVAVTGYTPYSGLGARCKVEIISRTALLRARGFKEV